MTALYYLVLAVGTAGLTVALLWLGLELRENLAAASGSA